MYQKTGPSCTHVCEGLTLEAHRGLSSAGSECEPIKHAERCWRFLISLSHRTAFIMFKRVSAWLERTRQMPPLWHFPEVANSGSEMESDSSQRARTYPDAFSSA